MAVDTPDGPANTPDGPANRAIAPTIHHQEPDDGTAVMEMARRGERNRLKRLLKVLGPGLIADASDDAKAIVAGG